MTTLPFAMSAMPPTDQKISAVASAQRWLGKEPSSPRLGRFGGGRQIVHVRIGAKRPLVFEGVIEKALQGGFAKAHGVKMPAQLLRSDKPVPAMGSDRQPAQDVLGADDGQRIGLERA